MLEQKVIIGKLAELIDLPTEEIKPISDIRALIDDSLAFVELIMELENTYDINITDTDIAHCRSVQDLIGVIQREHKEAE